MSLPIKSNGGVEYMYSCVIRPFHGNKEGFQTYDLYYLARPEGEENWKITERKLKNNTLPSLQLYARAIGAEIHNELFNISPLGDILWKFGNRRA